MAATRRPRPSQEQAPVAPGLVALQGSMQGQLQGFGLSVHDPAAAAEWQEVTLPPRETLDLSFDDARQFSLWVKLLGGLLRRVTRAAQEEETRKREEQLAMRAHEAWTNQQDWRRQPLPSAVPRRPSFSSGLHGGHRVTPPSRSHGAPARGAPQASSYDPISSLACKHDDFDEVVE